MIDTDARRQALRDRCTTLPADAQQTLRTAMLGRLGDTFTLKEPCTDDQLDVVEELLTEADPLGPVPTATDADRAALAAALADLPPDLAAAAAKVTAHSSADPARTDLPGWWATKVLRQAATHAEAATARHQRFMGELAGWGVEPDDDTLRHAVAHHASKGRTSSSRMLTADELVTAGVAAKDIGKGTLALGFLDDGTPTLQRPHVDEATGEIGPDGGAVDWKEQAARCGLSQAALLRQARSLAEHKDMKIPGGLKTMTADQVAVVLAWIDEQPDPATAPAPPEPVATEPAAPPAAVPAPEPAASTADAACLVVVHHPAGIRVLNLTADRVVELFGAA